MNIRFTPIAAALSGLATILVAGCGGGGDTSAAPPVATTTAVSMTVIDGAIRNALVCIDKNDNGVCDVGETQGRTDAAGKVTLDVPNDDVGKYPVVAAVGTDAIDADHGAVMVGYTLSTPADQTGVVSPLTTLVHRAAASTGASTAEAAKTVQDAIDAGFSLFADYTAVAAPTDSTLDAATLARMIVVATQQQQGTLGGVVGSPAVDGAVISQADLGVCRALTRTARA